MKIQLNFSRRFARCHDAPIGELTSDLFYLIGFTLVAMTIAAKRFTKRLD